MKRRTKNTLRAMAQHIGLKVKFVDYFEDDIHGQLLPREKRILINARKPRSEHIFTLLHEIGHYLVHFKNLRRLRNPRFLEIHWKSERLANFFSKIRRSLRYFRNCESGREWEADLWAVCALVYLARHHGFRDELRAFRSRHPEKTTLFLLASLGVTYGGIKSRVQKLYKTLWPPFQARPVRAVSRPNLSASIPRQPGLRSACVLVPSR